MIKARILGISTGRTTSLPVGRDCEHAVQPWETPSQNLTEISGHQRAETPKVSGGETTGHPESSGSKFSLGLPIATPEAGRQAIPSHF